MRQEFEKLEELIVLFFWELLKAHPEYKTDIAEIQKEIDHFRMKVIDRETAAVLKREIKNRLGGSDPCADCQRPTER